MYFELSDAKFIGHGLGCEGEGKGIARMESLGADEGNIKSFVKHDWKNVFYCL